MSDDQYVRTLENGSKEASVFAAYLKEHGRIASKDLIKLNIGGYYREGISNDEGYFNFAFDMLYYVVLCGLAHLNYDEDEGCGVFTWRVE